MTAGRHQTPDPPARFNGLRRFLGRVPLLAFSLGLGVVVACVVGVAAEIDYLNYRSVPREQAVVVRQVDGSGTRMCGKTESQEVLTTYDVADPRPGFTEEFVASECPGDSEPGEHVMVARRNSQSPAEVSPLNSQLEVLGVALGVGVLIFAAVTYWQLFLRWRS